jgi:hypothetical protein
VIARFPRVGLGFRSAAFQYLKVVFGFSKVALENLEVGLEYLKAGFGYWENRLRLETGDAWEGVKDCIKSDLSENYFYGKSMARFSSEN